MLSVIILAIIQALTEFIPVSSSGHLFIAQDVFGLEGSLALDVALHFGTLLALVMYFRHKLIDIVRELPRNQKLAKNIVITSVPAVLAGYFLNDLIVDDARSIGVVIFMLAFVGVIMILSERIFTSKAHFKKLEDIEAPDAAIIGLAQALALIPGTSRSGITMLAARSRGIPTRLAAEYSFLAAIPVIAGAAASVVMDSESQAALAENWLHTLVGVVLACVIGFAVLRFLLIYLSHKGLAIFGYYRLALALILFIIWLNQ